MDLHPKTGAISTKLAESKGRRIEPAYHDSIGEITLAVGRCYRAGMSGEGPREEASSDLQAVVLAGGLATRMRPRTERVPKLLLPVAGRPFAAWLLERIARSGYRRALICVAHLGDAIRRFVGDGSAFGLGVTYADEGEVLLGTAGALRRALSELDPMFLVTYGDSWLPFDYRAPLVDLAAHPDELGTLAVYRNEDRFDASNCEVRGGRVVRYEKRRAGDPRDPRLDHIDYGAIALRRGVIADLPEGAAIGLDAVQRRLAAAGRLRALPVADRFFEIGSEAGLADLEAELEKDLGR